ncbi:hypothetical protein AB0O34_12705 [Sphaerisporangium sp. NPDC088356]|uniref:hypothetical protein n=1 Tax=Sphaerisporangium sp. NPDC088356 TaxID=3154871 RepID=UPI003432FBB1
MTLDAAKPSTCQQTVSDGSACAAAETRLRLPDETYEQIKQIAGDDAQSVNSAMVVAIESVGDDACPDLWEKAAALMRSILIGHPPVG